MTSQAIASIERIRRDAAEAAMCVRWPRPLVHPHALHKHTLAHTGQKNVRRVLVHAFALLGRVRHMSSRADSRASRNSALIATAVSLPLGPVGLAVAGYMWIRHAKANNEAHSARRQLDGT